MKKIYFLLLLLIFSNSLAANSLLKKDTITILTFNDFHGAFVRDSSAKIPGAAIFVQALLDIKKKSPNPIVLSGGDNFSGSYFSRITQGKPIEALFNAVDLKYSAVGNHEFDWGKDYLQEIASHIPYVAANIFDSTGALPKVIPAYGIVEIPVWEGNKKIKIGFIGLTTIETGIKTSPENIKKLRFIPVSPEAVNPYIDTLKSKGAHVIMLLTHIGTKMNNGKPGFIDDDTCARNLPYIKNNSAIITAHSHEVVLGTINNIPIIQAATNGAYIGKMQFSVDENYHIEYIGGDTIKVNINGSANKAMEDSVKYYVQKYNFDSIYTLSAKELVHDRKINKNTYTEVGALVTASYVFKYSNKKYPVIGVNHFNGIRVGLPSGKITKLQAGNVLPFGGNLGAYFFTGSSLKELLEAGRKNGNGFLQTSSLSLYIEKDTIITRILSGNKEINDRDTCIVVCDDFLASGGDDYPAALFAHKVSSFSYDPTGAFLEYLSKQTVIPNSNVTVPVIYTGTKDAPYLINTIGDLDYYRSRINGGEDFRGKYFRQTANIDLSSIKNREPIGTEIHPFRGYYDGNSYAIENMAISKENQNQVGFFGCIEYGMVENLGITTCNVNGNDAVGGLVGSLKYTSTVQNCYVTGTITGKGFVGGLAGQNIYYSIIKNCYADIVCKNSKNNASIGGLVGYMDDAYIRNCYTKGTVISSGNKALTGGLLGSCFGNISIVRHSYSLCTVTGTGTNVTVGGLVGATAFSGKVLNCFAANDSISSSNTTGSINRVVGECSCSPTNYDLECNYALSTIIIKNGNKSGVRTSADHESKDGADKSLVELQRFLFYNNSTNNYWHRNISWDISTDKSKTWTIRDGEMYPYFPWQHK